jgi:hypothetical protein
MFPRRIREVEASEKKLHNEELLVIPNTIGVADVADRIATEQKR